MHILTFECTQTSGYHFIILFVSFLGYSVCGIVYQCVLHQLLFILLNTLEFEATFCHLTSFAFSTDKACHFFVFVHWSVWIMFINRVYHIYRKNHQNTSHYYSAKLYKSEKKHDGKSKYFEKWPRKLGSICVQIYDRKKLILLVIMLKVWKKKRSCFELKMWNVFFLLSSVKNDNWLAGFFVVPTAFEQTSHIQIPFINYYPRSAYLRCELQHSNVLTHRTPTKSKSLRV